MWFELLFPDQEVTPRRLRHKMERIGKAYSMADLNYFKCNLDNLVRFEMELSDHLVKVNLTKTILLQDPNLFSVEAGSSIELTNGLIHGLDSFRLTQRFPYSFNVKWMKRFYFLAHNEPLEFDVTRVRRYCEKLAKSVKTLKKKSDKQGLENLYSSSCDMLCKKRPPTSVQTLSCNIDCKKIMQVMDRDICNVKQQLMAERAKCENMILQCNLLREERDALRVSIDKLDNIKDELSNVKRDCAVKETLLDDLKSSKLYKRNCIYKKNIRKQSAELRNVREEMSRSDASYKRQTSMLQKKLCDTKRKLKSEQTMKSKYKLLYKEKLELLKNGSHENEPEIVLKDSRYNRYSEKVRLTYMALMSEANLAAQNCSSAVYIIANYLFGKDIKMDDLPSVSTVLNFANEAYHIAHTHVIQKISDSDFFTLASDGTSRQKRQYLERHVILNNKCTMSLGFTHIARDDADTLLEKTLEVLDDLCEIYCMSSELKTKDQVFKDIIRKLNCLMSDRAAVNKAYNKKMLEFKKELVGEDETIQFVFCNAHFLLGLVTAVDKAVTTLESQLGKLGRDQLSQFYSFSNSSECAALRAIRIASDIFGPRGDEKCGCREEWLAYCELVQRPSLFTSYRTNRFNNLFQNASALIYHHEDICAFLSGHVSHSNLKFQSLLADVKDVNILSLVGAIALFHVNFSGPYWLLMNCNSVSYGQFPEYVSLMKACLGRWSFEEEPFDVALTTTVFSDFTCSDFELTKFISSLSCDKAVLSSAFVGLSQQSKLVLERQLNDFLDGGIYGGALDENVCKVLNSCPLTNLVGERLFGDLDCDIQRRRNASLHLRSTLNMLKRNKTVKWVRRLDVQTSSDIMTNARKHAVSLKNKSKARDKEVRAKVKARIVKNKEDKTSQEIKNMEKKRVALEAVISHGGICDDKRELDSLVQQPNALERLKEQIRFRKIILKEQISCTGNTRVLYERLCHHLGFEPSPIPTRCKKRKGV